MTDNLQFFDPETGKPLHRVPDGATIPQDMPYGLIEDGKHWWCPQAPGWDLRQEDNVPRFTREPLSPPALPLPTEPGCYLDKDGTLWHVDLGGESAILLSRGQVFSGNYYSWDKHDLMCAPFTPATVVPTETWDRLRVLDPEDTRDRVDRDGDIMRLTTQSKAVWGDELAARHWRYGPLRFADEVSDL